MKLIHYAGETLLTGDKIADAILRYAGALSAREDSATISIPVRMSDGAIATASMLIGPASQLVAVPQKNEFDEILDEDLIGQMDREVGRLSMAHPQVDIRSADQTSAGAPSEWEL